VSGGSETPVRKPWVAGRGWDASHNRTLVLVPERRRVPHCYSRSSGLPVWSDPFGSEIVSTPLDRGLERLDRPELEWEALQAQPVDWRHRVLAPVINGNGAIITPKPTLATPPGGRPTVYIGPTTTV